jgi:hypothetical protein
VLSGQNLGDAFLDDRRLPLVDEINLGLLGVNSDDPVSRLCETSGPHAAHIAQPKDAYIHLVTSFLQARIDCSFSRRRAPGS